MEANIIAMYCIQVCVVGTLLVIDNRLHLASSHFPSRHTTSVRRHIDVGLTSWLGTVSSGFWFVELALRTKVSSDNFSLSLLTLHIAATFASLKCCTHVPKLKKLQSLVIDEIMFSTGFAERGIDMDMRNMWSAFTADYRLHGVICNTLYPCIIQECSSWRPPCDMLSSEGWLQWSFNLNELAVSAHHKHLGPEPELFDIFNHWWVLETGLLWWLLLQNFEPETMTWTMVL